MLNFTFCNPTRIHFGKEQIAKIDTEIPKEARVLVTFGGGSVKHNGTYDEVLKALGTRTVAEFWGIEPNPTYETLMKAVEMARREKSDFLLAVGGGSVIDGTKFIAAAVPFLGDPWDLVLDPHSITTAMPFGSVLTLPATGSEMNCGSVVTHKARHDKRPFGMPLLYPRFSILDPTKTYSLPPKQITNGIADTFVHITEQYLNYPANTPIQDRFAEGLLLTLIEEGPKALETPEDYEVRANLMWCSTMALNGLLGAGAPQDWSSHELSHEVTEKYGIDHGRALAIVHPAMLSVRRKEKAVKLAQYGRRVWHLSGTDDEVIDRAIAKTISFFEGLGIPTRLSAYGITADAIPGIIKQLTEHGYVAMGERRDVTPAVSTQVLAAAL